MGYRIQELQIAGFTCRLYLPSDYDEGDRRYPAVYVNGEVAAKDILTNIVKIGAQTDFILLSVKPKNWNDDFTPWAAPAFREGGGSAAGQGGPILILPDGGDKALHGYSLPHKART